MPGPPFVRDKPLLECAWDSPEFGVRCELWLHPDPDVPQWTVQGWNRAYQRIDAPAAYCEVDHETARHLMSAESGARPYFERRIAAFLAGPATGG